MATATTYPESGQVPDLTDTGDPSASGDERNLAALVKKRWEQGTQELMLIRRNYWINLAFYLGEQWLWWNEARNMVDQLPLAWSPLGPDKARIVENRIRPNMNIVLGRMLDVPLPFEVPPTDGADDCVLGARKAEKILEAYHREHDWESVRHDELADAFYGGVSAVLLEWDGTRGKELRYDNGSDQVVATGDCFLRSLNATEFCLEPNTRPGEARWGIIGLATPIEAVKEQYRLKWTPMPDAGIGRTPVHVHLLNATGRPAERDQCLVLTMYERPSHANRKGRYVVVINDRVVHQGPWPFPFDRLNIYPFRQARIPGKWFGDTLLNDAIKLQFAYNFSRSVLQEHLKVLGNMRVIAPRGAFHEDDFTTDVGDILWYQPDNAGGKPEFMVPPNLARWVSAEPENLRAAIDELMHVHAISRGEGFDRASGQALALLSEKDDTPLGIMAHEQAARWSMIGSDVLKLLEAKGTERRSVSIPLTKTTPERIEWTGKELRGQTTAKVPIEAVRAQPAAARQAFWRDLWDRKIITDARQYAKGVGLPPEDFEMLLDPDAARAQTENYRMMQGIVELPEDFDDHAIHMAEHNRFRKTDSYKYADAEARSIIDDHIAYHEKLVHQEMAEQVSRAKVNPVLPAIPQANQPPGAFVPPSGAEQQQAMMMQQGPPPSGSNMDLPPGGTTPALASGVMGGQ